MVYNGNNGKYWLIMVYNLVNEHPHATDFAVPPGVDTWLLALFPQ